MALELGPVQLHLAAEAPWDAAVCALLAGFEPAVSEPATSACPTARPSADLFPFALALGSGPPPAGERRPPRFEAVPDEPGRWVDASESWDASLATTALGARATFALRTRRTEPHVQRELAASALRVALATVAPLAGAVLVHGACLATPEGALVFLGPSGEGKTTMVRRLRDWALLSDDATLVTPTSAGGTPLRGKEGLPRSAARRPLAGLVMLSKGAAAPRFERLAPAQAMALLLPRVFWYARAPELERTLLEVLARLVETVPTWSLASSLEHDVGPWLRAAARREVA